MNDIGEKNYLMSGVAQESSVQNIVTQISDVATNASTAATKASSAATDAANAKSNTAINNTASSTGTLSQKLSHIISQMGTISTNINNSIEKTFVSTASNTVIKTLLSGSVTATTNSFKNAVTFRVVGFSGQLRILYNYEGGLNANGVAVYVEGVNLASSTGEDSQSLDFYVNEGDSVEIKVAGGKTTWDTGTVNYYDGTISNVRLCGTITETQKTYNWDVIIT